MNLRLPDWPIRDDVGIGEKDLRKLFSWAFAALVGWAFSLLAAAADAEVWRFDVWYQGMFSGGQPVDIADATLTNEALPGEPWSLSEIAISSAGHAFPESVYPFRYRLRSLHNAEMGSLAFARFKRARKSTDEVWLLNHNRRRFLRYRQQGNGEELPDAIAQKLAPGVALRFQREGAALRVTPLFDQLGLFQRLRNLPFQPGASFRLSATDGKKILDYRISVLARSPLPTRERAWNTWKLRIESRRANGKTAHQPILLWLEDSEERIPVKAETRHPIGIFTIRLAATAGGRFGRLDSFSHGEPGA